jgi:hypothetical protein
VIGEIRASLRQQHVQALGPIDERNEDGSRRRLAFAPRHSEAVAQAFGARGRRSRQSFTEPGALQTRREIEQRKMHGDSTAWRARRDAPDDSASVQMPCDAAARGGSGVLVGNR